MNKPKIINGGVETLYHNKYVKLYGMHFDSGNYYLEASRREPEDIVALKSEEELKNLVPDAVTCILVLNLPGKEPLLYMEHEFRFPAGQFLVSPPAGLIDKEDYLLGDPRIVAAKREIKEETGVEVKDSDEIKVVSPLFFSSPGMTDEANAIVVARVSLPDLSSLTNDGAEGTECFDGYSLYTKAQAKELINNAKDENNNRFSVFTWAVLMYFAYVLE